MASLFSPALIVAMQGVLAPDGDDELAHEVEVWRLPGAGDEVVPGGAGVGPSGLPIEDSEDEDRPDLTRAKVETYFARKRAILPQAQMGGEQEFGAQEQTVNLWKFVFSGADDVDVQGGDRLKDGNDWFEVKNPGGQDTFIVLREVMAQRIGS